jgi:hypothetical protein
MSLMDVARTSETSVNFYETTRRYNQKTAIYLHTYFYRNINWYCRMLTDVSETFQSSETVSVAWIQECGVCKVRYVYLNQNSHDLP